MTGRLIPAIALVVVVIDVVLLATSTITPPVALALFLAVEIPIGVAVVSGYLRRYRAHRAAADTRADAVRALAADDPYLRMMTAEARTLASLGRELHRAGDSRRRRGRSLAGRARRDISDPGAHTPGAGQRAALPVECTRAAGGQLDPTARR